MQEKHHRFVRATANGETLRFDEGDRLIMQIVGKQDASETNSVEGNEPPSKRTKTEAEPQEYYADAYEQQNDEMNDAAYDEQTNHPTLLEEFVITEECSPPPEQSDEVFGATDIDWSHNGDLNNYLHQRSLASAENNSNFMRPKFVENELNVLRKQKIEIKTKLCIEQLHIAERQRYKLDLELMKLEQELGLPASKFTRKFFEN